MSLTSFSVLLLTLIRLTGCEKPLKWSWAVTLRGGSASEVADNLGMQNMGEVLPGSKIYEFSYVHESRTTRDDVVGLHARLLDHRHVNEAELQKPLVRVRRAVEFNDPSFLNQWHLVNYLEAGHDLNVTGVWEMGVKGGRVSVAVVDDGLEHTNPELRDNYNSEGSYDFNDNDDDPTPDLSELPTYNSHGTRCAGLVAAVADNGVCGVGVAYKATVSGIRMLDGTITDILEAKSLTYKTHINSIYSCSWGPSDDGRTVEGPGPLALSAFQQGTSQGRFGYGSIFVFAAGNGGSDGDNCNFDGYANSIFTLTIGAVDEQDLQPYYSEDCAAKFAVTYSNGRGRSDRNVVTADVTSTTKYCTNSFSGTSAAAPMAAGVVALVLEVRPCLTWRDVQSLVVFTAMPVDAEKAEWAENGAGLRHSHQHGYGVLHAYSIVMAAKVWPLLPPQAVWSSTAISTKRPIPFGTPDSLTEDMEINAADLPSDLSTLEHVTVTVTIKHSFRGALVISLTSPSGTRSQLATARLHDSSASGLTGWEFTTIFCWGETPTGVWSLNVKDKASLGSLPVSGNSRGKLISWKLTLYGSSLSAEEVSSRKRMVESVKSGNSSIPLAPPCPPHPADVTDIVFSDTSKEILAVQVIAGILVILVTLLAINAVVQYLRQHNICRRKDYVSALPQVHFKPSTVVDEEAVLLLNDTEEPHSPPQVEEPPPPLTIASSGADQLQENSLSLTKDQLRNGNS